MSKTVVDETELEVTCAKTSRVSLQTRTMESEDGRKAFLVFPTSKSQASSQKGRKGALKGNGRRIDYLLYSKEGLYLEWKTVSYF